MKPGNATVDAVLDGEFTINRDFVYPGIAPERWKPYEHLLNTFGVPFAAAHFRNFDWGRILHTDAGLQWQAIDDTVA